MAIDLPTAGLMPTVDRTQAELAALRLIRAGLRHPHEVNELRMATDVAQALGLIETVPRTMRRNPLTGGRIQAGRPTTRAARSPQPCRTCTHAASRHDDRGCHNHGCYCLAGNPAAAGPVPMAPESLQSRWRCETCRDVGADHAPAAGPCQLDGCACREFRPRHP